jgi:redox-sensitive bicupin YhaK (pirin superfamily)
MMESMIIPERRRRLGGGLEVGRILPYAKRRMVGPFIFLDHMGPIDLTKDEASLMDVLPHPHIGLSTLTYLFDGEIVHRDSVATTVSIDAGAVNWMTAGRGITHSERFEKARLGGDRIHGVQAWVALPDGKEEIEPEFAHHAKNTLPTWEDAGVRGRLLAGSLYGLTAPPKTYSPLHYAHLDMHKGAKAELPAHHPERALYIASGTIEMDGTRFEAGQMLVLQAGTSWVRAIEPSTLMLLGGEPIGERHIYWNFVSSRKDRLEQAAQDWQAGRMKLPDADQQAFTPLPAGPGPLTPGFS